MTKAASKHLHERVSFPGPQGKLSGILQLPESEPKASVLQAHCFTCSKSLKVTRALATGIEDGGYAVLRFDFTGLGESEGEFAETNVTSNVADLEAAAHYLENRGMGPCAMVGHSLGGAAALLATDRLPSIKAVAVVASPASPDHVMHLFDEQDVEQAFESGATRVTIAGRPFLISKEFFEDLKQHCTPELIGELKRPLLVVHGTADRVVPIEEGEKIFDAAGQPRWFAALPGADHLLTRPEHSAQAAAAIRTFLDTALAVGGE